MQLQRRPDRALAYAAPYEALEQPQRRLRGAAVRAQELHGLRAQAEVHHDRGAAASALVATSCFRSGFTFGDSFKIMV